MKKRLGKTIVLLIVGAIVGAIGYFGIDHYYETHRRTSEAESSEFVEQARQRQVIPIEFEVAAPPETPADQPLFLSGSEPAFGNWEPAGVLLARGEDGKYRCKVEVTQGIDYAYKITRGTWSTVEKGAGGEEIPNRSLKLDQPQVVKVSVASWVDGGKAVPNRITLAGDIRLHKKFQSKVLGNERTIVVYLPPGYEHSTEQRFPVLYMHDGQNLFDESTSYAGVEWKLDEAAQLLISDGKIKPVIIVGIYNTPDRTPEFTPPPTGRADQYARFIVEELKPFIDHTYRTLPDRANTALGGSSMGGMATLLIAQSKPEAFSQVALLTPFLRHEGKLLIDSSASGAWLKGMRVWVDMGTSPAKYYPGDDPLGDARAFVKFLESNGLRPNIDFYLLEVPSGEHTESSWQKRVPEVLQFLFGTVDSPATAPTAQR